MKRIRVIIKNPGEKYGHVTNISNSLRNLQRTVDGHIEAVTFPDFVIICNEEGRLMNLPKNVSVDGIDFCGTIIVCGVSGEEFGDLGITFDDWKAMFSKKIDYSTKEA